MTRDRTSVRYAFVIASVLGCSAMAPTWAVTQPTATEERGCPNSPVVELLTEGRKKAAAGNLLTARQDFFEPLSRHEDLVNCSTDLQLKVRREYGDVLAKLASRKTGEEQGRYKTLAAEQYGEYLTLYLEKGDPAELADPSTEQYPRVVLNAYANMMFETGEYGALCDTLTRVAEGVPQLFDPKAIEKWKKSMTAAPWDDPTKLARLREYCSLFAQPDLAISEGARSEHSSECPSS